MAALTKLAVLLGCLVTAGACSGPPPAAAPKPVTVSPSNIVRQGQQGITIAIAREDSTTPLTVDLEDLSVAMKPDQRQRRLVLAVSVPHGAKAGTRALTIVSARGVTKIPDVIDVTPITAAPGGSDANDGTARAPFRSLKQALAVSGPGDTVRLEGGTYDPSNGETWSYRPSSPLTIAGAPASAVVLSAGGTGAAAFEPAADLSLRNLTITGFDAAVRLVEGGRTTLEEVAVRDSRTAAIVLEGAGSTASLRGGSVSGDAEAVILKNCDRCQIDIAATAISVVGDDVRAVNVHDTSRGSRVSIRDARFTSGVLVADPEATVAIAGVTIDLQGANNAAVNFAGARLELSSSTIRAGEAPYALALRAGSASLSDLKLEGGNYSVYQLAGSTKVRRSELKGYGFVAYYLADGHLDLGTGDEAGDNVLFGPSTSEALFGIYNDSASPATSSNTTFDGIVPLPGTVEARDGPVSEPRKYFIATGRSMKFFRVP
jgi:hypothetical protein